MTHPIFDDPRFEKVREAVAKAKKPDYYIGSVNCGPANWVIPRKFYLEAGFSDEEINAGHSLGKNLK